MSLRVCPDCKALYERHSSGRCVTCRRAKDRARGSRYDSKHRALSKVERAKAIGSACHFCGEVMTASQPLALDHTEDRADYRGVTHLSCNASDGAKRGNALRNG